MQEVQQAFECLPEIEEEMTAIGHLQSRWCTFSSARGVLGAAVTGHNFDPWMCAEPSGKALRRMIQQHIDGTLLLNIDQQRAVSAPFVECKIIHAQDPRSRSGSRWRLAYKAEEGIGAHLHVEVADHLGSGLTAQGKAQHPEDAGQAHRVLRTYWYHSRDALGKGPLGTVLIAAKKASDMEHQSHGATAHREIARRVGITAVNARGGLSTSRTKGRGRGGMGNDDERRCGRRDLKNRQRR